MSKVGEGVASDYKERAHKGGDVLWTVTIKGQRELAPGIPLHMSLKVFEDKKDLDVEDIKERVKKFDIKTPNPNDLKYKTTIFTSEITGTKHFMLLIDGLPKECEEFYDSMKNQGTTYKKFMPHVTIDKGLYEKINEDGLEPHEVEFFPLSIEAGAGKTVHQFQKSEFLTGKIIKETVLLNESLSHHNNVLMLSDSYLKYYLEDNPLFKSEIMDKYQERLTSHFGDDHKLIQIAWEKGIEEAYKVKGK